MCLQYSLIKTLWEKEKLLVMSYFSFPHIVFYLFQKLSAIIIKFEIVVCKLFQFGRVWNLSLEKRLTLSQTTIFLYFSKLKEVADDDFKFHENGRKFFEQVENTVGNGEIARYELFLRFPQSFQKTFTADT